MKAVEAEFAVGDSKTHDTVEKQLSLREASMEGEVFPTVGGLSLGLSLFPEEGLGSTSVVCDAVLFEDVLGPDEVLTHVGGVSLFLELDLCSAEERLTESPTMLSVEVLVCDNTEDIVADTWFKDVLQRGDVEWEPCPPDVHVWISHNKAICRPRPWPSFACNQLKDVQMTFARLPRRTTYSTYGALFNPTPMVTTDQQLRMLAADTCSTKCCHTEANIHQPDFPREMILTAPLNAAMFDNPRDKILRGSHQCWRFVHVLGV
jgi:hypothetical protein